MIVLDENIHGRRITEAIRSWYRGQVVSITTLRPNSVIKDEAIPALLIQANRPTFVTINTDDFWRHTRAHPRYCIVNVDLPKERTLEVPTVLRRLLRVPGFATKSERMGKIVRVLSGHVEFYGRDGLVQVVAWPD